MILLDIMNYVEASYNYKLQIGYITLYIEREVIFNSPHHTTPYYTTKQTSHKPHLHVVNPMNIPLFLWGTSDDPWFLSHIELGIFHLTEV